MFQLDLKDIAIAAAAVAATWSAGAKPLEAEPMFFEGSAEPNEIRVARLAYVR